MFIPRSNYRFRPIIRAKINRAIKSIRSENGNTESALVLIPLLVLFLITMQLGLAINFRNIDRTFAQSEASERAISGQFHSSDDILKINPFGAFNSLELLVVKKVSRIPVLLPFIGTFINRGNKTDVSGIAVMESLS